MPLRRTPPTSPHVTCTLEPLSAVTALNPALTHKLQHCVSEPDINVSKSAEEIDCGDHNITQRFKRKRSEYSNDKLTDFMSEVKSMFAELKAQQLSQDAKMDKISVAVDEIKAQNVAVQNTTEFLANKFECIQSQIDKLESDRCNTSQCIQALEEKLENVERFKRATCIEIKNIPYVTGETKQVLLKHVSSIANVLKTSVDPLSVRDIFRISKKDSEDKTIIVDFTSVLTKEIIIQKYKEYNKHYRTSKFSTESLHISGPRRPVFISENLTPKMKRLLYLSKEFAKSNAFNYCWVSHGKIYLRKKEGTGAFPIRSEIDLKNLITPNNL